MIPRLAIIYAANQQDADFGVVFANWCGLSDSDEVIEDNATDNSTLFTFLMATMADSHERGYFPATIICCDPALITAKLKTFVSTKSVGFVDAAEMWSRIDMPDSDFPLCRYSRIDMPLLWEDEEGHRSFCPFVFDRLDGDERNGYARRCKYENATAACPHREDFQSNFMKYAAIKESAIRNNYEIVTAHFLEERLKFARSTETTSGIHNSERRRTISEEALGHKKVIYAKMIELLDAADHPLTHDEIVDLLDKDSSTRFTTLDGKVRWDKTRIAKILTDLEVLSDWNQRKAKKLIQSGA
jgi:hypothetical protein